jgi:hypothetical protein
MSAKNSSDENNKSFIILVTTEAPKNGNFFLKPSIRCSYITKKYLQIIVAKKDYGRCSHKLSQFYETLKRFPVTAKAKIEFELI